MKITTVPLESRQVRLTVEVEEERVQQEMQRTARRISQEVNIPGFRKGKAPYSLIVQRLGEKTVREEAVKAMAEDIFKEATQQENLTAYSVHAENVEMDPLTFSFIVSLPPVVDLGDYRSFRLPPPQVTVAEQEVQDALQEIRKQHMLYELAERPAAMEDGVTINLSGRTRDGVPFTQQENVRILLESDGGQLLPGLAENIVGMSAGDERTFTLTLPPDFAREDLRGQEAEFTVKVLEVYQGNLPALDDDLARTVGNFDSIAELEDAIREQLRHRAQEETENKYAAEALEAFYKQAHIQYPPDMLEEELDQIVKDMEQAVKRDTKLSLDDYLRYRGQTMENLRSELQPQAKTRLERGLLLSEVVTRENLRVDDAEIDASVERISASWGVRAEEVRANLQSGAGRDAVHNRLLTQKAIQRLVSIAKGELEETAEAQEGSNE